VFEKYAMHRLVISKIELNSTMNFLPSTSARFRVKKQVRPFTTRQSDLPDSRSTRLAQVSPWVCVHE
jgi:hypothetical protein